MTTTAICPECNGTRAVSVVVDSRTLSLTCRTCHGTGDVPSETVIRFDYGRSVAQARKALDLTPSELSTIIGFDYITYSKCERHPSVIDNATWGTFVTRTNPIVQGYERLSRALDVTRGAKWPAWPSIQS